MWAENREATCRFASSSTPLFSDAFRAHLEPPKELPEYATVSELIRLATPNGTPAISPELIVFFVPLFSTQMVFLSLIRDRFHGPGPKAVMSQFSEVSTVRRNVLDLLEVWMRHVRGVYFGAVEAELLHFLTEVVATLFPAHARELCALVAPPSPRTVLAQPDVPEIPSAAPSQWTLLDLPPLEVARQLTLHDFALFRRLNVCEFLEQRWFGRARDVTAPNLRHFSAEMAHRSAVVETAVLSARGGAPARAAVLEFWVRVCRNLYTLRNFAGFAACMMGLVAPNVDRLRATHAALTPKAGAQLAELRSDADLGGAFERLKATQAAAPRPLIPHVQAFLTDIVYIEDGCGATVDGTFVNVAKLQHLGVIIRTITECQEVPFSLVPVPKIQYFLAALPCFSSERIRELSRALEPPQ